MSLAMAPVPTSFLPPSAIVFGPLAAPAPFTFLLCEVLEGRAQLGEDQHLGISKHPSLYHLDDTIFAFCFALLVLLVVGLWHSWAFLKKWKWGAHGPSMPLNILKTSTICAIACRMCAADKVDDSTARGREKLFRKDVGAGRWSRWR